MATWTDIPDEVLEPGKPIRSVDALALRDNAIAIAEGAPNAPRIAGQQGPAVHTGGIVNGAVTNAKIATMDASKLTGTINGARIPTGHGGVGTYAFVTRSSGNPVNWGGTILGSSLIRASIQNGAGESPVFGSGALTGTWRIMGHSVSNLSSTMVATLAVRIS